MAIKWSFIFSTGDSGINNFELPLSVFKELEYSETLLDSIVVDEILEELRVCSKTKERAQKPAVSKHTLFNITWLQPVLHHQGFILSCIDFLWT